MKEEVVNDRVEFGKFSIYNATTYNTLHAQVDSISRQLNNNELFNLKPGPNQITISGLGSSPTDVPVVIFDTLLNVESNKKYQFVLFQPTPDASPKAIIEDQVNEPIPEAGKVKIRIANYAVNCFPDNIDLEFLMFDYNFNAVPVDTIRNISHEFGEFQSYQLMDRSIAASGYLAFTPLNPTTNQPTSETIAGIELDDYINGTWYNVVTLYITEQLSEYGSIVAPNGNRYELTVKLLFYK
jgi:hypothetical protein